MNKITLIGLVLVSLGVWIFVNSQDDTTVDDAEILAFLPVDVEADNGLLAIKHIIDPGDSGLSTDDIKALRGLVNFGASSGPAMSELLIQHRSKLADLSRAVRQPYLRFEASEEWWDSPNFSAVMGLNRLAIAQSMDYADKNKIDEAIKTLEVAVLFSERIRASRPTTLLHYMVGDAMMFDAFNWAHQIAQHPDMDIERYHQLLFVLNSASGFGSDKFYRMYAGEYLFVRMAMSEGIGERKSIQKILIDYDGEFEGAEVDQEKSNPLDQFLTWLLYDYIYHPNAFHTELAANYLALAKQSAVQCSDLISAEPDEAVSFFDVFRPKWINKKLLSIRPDFNTYLYQRCHSHNYFSAVNTAIAFKAYQTKYGLLPESIELVVPEFLPAVPIDTFSGLPINYSLEKRWFYMDGVGVAESGGTELGIYKRRCKEGDGCWSQPTVPLMPLAAETAQDDISEKSDDCEEDAEE